MLAQIRQQQGHSGSLAPGMDDDEEHHFWSHCLLPAPVCKVPKPVAELQIHWHPESSGRELEGKVYVDGSRQDGYHRWHTAHCLTRAGCGLATIRGPGDWAIMAWAPLPYIDQAINPAELFAALSGLMQ